MSIASPTEKFNSLDLALAYIARYPGRYIFPIKAAAKFPPLLRDNLEKASSDPKQLTAWARKFPNCNWGLALKKSRVFVADIDTKPGKFGQQTYDELDLLYGWPETGEITETPSGGKHYYYEGEHVFALGTRGFGLDIDSPNYVLIPGCTFKDGTGYTAIGDGDAVPAPQWFYDVISQAKVKVENAGEAAVELDRQDAVTWAIDYLRNDAEPSIEGKGGDFTTLKVAMSLRDNGISEPRAVELMNEYYNVPGLCEPEWELEALTQKVRNAYAYASMSQIGGKTAEADFADDDVSATADSIKPQGDAETIESQKQERAEAKQDTETQSKDLPTVVVDMANLPATTRKVQRLLIAHGKKKDAAPADQVFQRGGSLVHLNRNRLKPGVTVDKHYHVEDDLLITAVEAGWLSDRLERCMTFGRVGKKKGDAGRAQSRFIATAAPPVIVTRLEAIKQDWKYPPLAGTVETPTIRADGTILDKPGYDTRSGLYFDPGRVTFPTIKQNPTKADALEALAVLRDPIRDFPFADDDDNVKSDTVSESVMLSAMLLAVCRRQISVAPMYGIDANLAQSGKTELAQVLSIMMTGREAACRPLARDEYQRSTALAAAFEAGDSFILFDNIDGDKQTIEGEALCMALTSPTFQMRRLGGNSAADQIIAPTNSLIVGTGNKLTASGDMTEDRLLMIKLRPDKPLPDRKFSHLPLNSYVLQRRPHLVAAALTILRAYHLADDKKPGKHFRFAEWRSKIADAIVWLGLPDPVQSTEAVKADNPVTEAQREVMKVWAEHIGDRKVTTKQAMEIGDLVRAVADAKGLDERRITKEMFGLYLKGMKGVDLLGRKMQQTKGGHDKTSLWEVRRLEDAPPIAPAAPADQGNDEADFGFGEAEPEPWE